MNLSYKFRFFVAAICAMFFSVACESTDPNEDSPVVLTDAFTLTLSGNDVDYLALKVTVSEESPVVNYVVGVVTESDFNDVYSGDLSAAAAGVVADLSSSVDFAAADNKYVFSTSQTVDVASAWPLVGGETYMVLVFGVDAKGNQTSNVAYKSVVMSRDSLYSDDYEGVVFINEVDPNNNIIEIYSAAKFTVPCDDFVVENEDGETVKFSADIASSGFYLVEGLKVNPMGDSLILYDGDGLIVDEVEIVSVSTGSTYGRASDGADSWVEFESGNTTLGAANGKISVSGEAFTVQEYYTTDSQIVLYVTPNADIEDYYFAYGYCTKEEFDTYFANGDELVEYYLEYYRSIDVNFETHNDVVLFGGPYYEGGELLSVITEEANTEFVIAVAAIDADGHAVTSAVTTTATSTGEYPETAPEYSQWLGTWTVKSTGSYNGANVPVSFDVTISEDIANYSYFVTGWELSVMRDNGVGHLAYLSGDGQFYIEGEPFITYLSEEDSGVFNGYVYNGTICSVEGYGTDYYIVGGAYPALISTMNSDSTSAEVAAYSGELSNNLGFQVLHKMLVFTDMANETLYTYSYSDAYSDENEPVGPYSMTLKSSTAPASAPAKAPRLMEDVIRNAKAQRSPLKVFQAK
ncbi:MAG: hypothetical protein R3Y08_01150 [Rikenellaceae bacterium]